jgi:hypothetical protein
MSKHWEIKNRMIHIYPAPVENGGKLTLNIRASKYWLRKNKSILPEFYTTLNEGQNDYPLPKYIRIKNIIGVTF